MAKSLQEQLLGAGLVDKKKAKSLKQEQRKQKKQQPKGQLQQDEQKQRLEKDRLAKIEHDRMLNQQRLDKLREKEIIAQIKQLVSQHRIDRKDGDIGFQFVDATKIQKIYVTQVMQEQLSRGQIQIIKQGESYELVPSVIAQKVAQWDASYLIAVKQDETQQVDEDDPYADYKIPDDLMW